jgi:cell division protein FtsB
VVFAVLLLAGYDGSRDLARLKVREAQLEARLRKTEAGIVELRQRIGNLRSDPYTLERVAREELGLSRAGEIVVILPPAVTTAEGAGTTPKP